MAELPGLYVHVPFCRGRCGYCAFASGEYDAARAERYVDAVARECAARAAGRTFGTVFIGGGTPTALGAPTLSRLLAALRPATAGAGEFTMEANPASFDAAAADAARAGGVDRLSFGVQTFSTRGLAALGRRQAPGDAARAVAAARAAGFARLGIDLIAGWPGQALADWRADLEAALALGVEHISCYGLAVEPRTPLGRAVAAGRAAVPGEEFDRACWDLAGERLAAAGLPRYEVSNHARPGRECRHSVLYWTGGEYVGLGAAAHSHENGRRFANTADADAYAAHWSMARPDPAGAEAFSETLPPEAKARETLVAWLRMVDGVDLAAFRARTGFALDRLIAAEWPRLAAQGWLARSADGRRVRLADPVLPVADVVLRELVADPE